MGRRLKYGEKTKWVSVRVPESKVQLVRGWIREFVDILFLPSVIPKKNFLEGFIVKVLNELANKKKAKDENRKLSEFAI